MSATATDSSVPPDFDLKIERTSGGYRLTISTANPFVPLGCTLDEERHHKSTGGPIVLEKIGQTGRLYDGEGYELDRIPVKGKMTGRQVLETLDPAISMPNVCVLNGLFKINALLPDDWEKEGGETFFLGTLFGTKPLDSGKGNDVLYVLSLSKENGVVHWNVRDLDADFSGCYVAIAKLPAWGFKSAA